MTAWAAPTLRQAGAMNISIARNHSAGRRQTWDILQRAPTFWHEPEFLELASQRPRMKRSAEVGIGLTSQDC